MAAGVYMKVTEGSYNCYEVFFHLEGREYTFCDVPQRILIAFPANKDQIIDAWLQVDVNFNGKTAYGNFDCEATSSDSLISDFWKAAVLPDVAKAMGNSVEDWMDPCFECFSQDEAFNLDSWRSSQQCNAHLKAGE